MRTLPALRRPRRQADGALELRGLRCVDPRTLGWMDDVVDHVAVGSSGVFLVVVDHDRGHSHQERSHLVDLLHRQADLVEEVLGVERRVPVRLMVVDGHPGGQRTERISLADGIWTGPAAEAERELRRPGPFPPEAVDDVVAVLEGYPAVR